MWEQFEKYGVVQARPYQPGDDLSDVSVSDVDDPSEGDMICRNPEKPEDKWLVDQQYFDNHYERV